MSYCPGDRLIHLFELFVLLYLLAENWMLERRIANMEVFVFADDDEDDDDDDPDDPEKEPAPVKEEEEPAPMPVLKIVGRR